MTGQHHEYASDPLTERELQDVRRIIEADRRAVWFWSTIRTWATWTAVVVGGVTVGWDFVKKVIAAALRGGGT